MELEEDIPKSQDATNTVNFRNPTRNMWYIIFVKPEYVREEQASGGDSMSIFRGLMKDAGCSEALIDPRCFTSFAFGARLILEEVHKLSDLDSVRGVNPDGAFKPAY